MQINLFQEDHGKFSLRPYQAEASRAIMDSYSRGKNPLVIMATGTGKTITFADPIRQLYKENKRSLVLAHRETLIDQAIDKIYKYTGYKPSKEKAQDWAVDESNIIVASVQSLQNKRLDRFADDNFALMVTDEAHHAVSKSYKNISEYFNPTSHLGVTATPDRADEKSLGAIYDEIAYEYNLANAIKDGYLVPIEGYRIKDFNIDLSNLRIHMGDYRDSDLEGVIEQYIAPICKNIVDQTEEMKTMVFLPTVESSRLVAETLKDMSVKADYISGGTKNQGAVLYNFHVGNITHLVSCDMLLEGYDEPTVQAIVMLRPTSSRSLYSQIVGRGTRLSPGKEALKLVEFTYNSDRLKLVSPYELFSTDRFNERVREYAEAGGLEGQNLLDELEQASEQVFAISNILDRLIIPSNTFVRFDPLALGDMIDVDITGEFDLHYQGRKIEGSVTRKQKDILARYGITDFSEMDRAQASKLIGGLFEKGYRPLTGPATNRQIMFLKKEGIDATEMKKAQASMLIDKIKEQKVSNIERMESKLTF